MGQVCSLGRCACSVGQTLCGVGAAAMCVDTATNSANCGRCSNPCAAGSSCVGGVCRGMPPANDTRAGATVIDLTNPSQTLMANTTEARNDTTSSCGCTSGNDVFFAFTLTEPEVVYADTLGASFDTSLFFQTSTGGSVTAATGSVVCNDDAASASLCSSVSGLQSMIAARLPAGSYNLVLSGCGAGTAAIKFQHLPAGAGTNVRVTPTSSVQTTTGSTPGAGTVNSTCCSSGGENSIWWLSCPNTAAASFYGSTCNPSTGVNRANYNSSLSQYSALRAGPAVQVCNDDVGFVCANGSTVTSTIPATAANQVGLNALIIDGCTATGTYSVDYILGTCASGLRCGASCINDQTDNNHCGGCDRRCAAGSTCRAGVCSAAPANDLPAMATPINMSVVQSIFTVDTTAAVNNVTGSCSCTTGNDVFYSFTIPAGQSEIVYADTVGSMFDTSLFVQTTAGVNVTNANLPANGVACNDDSGLAGCSTGLQSQIMLRLDAGSYYLVLSGCGRGMATVRFQHLPTGNGALAHLSGSATPAGTTGGTGRLTSSCGSGGPENSYYWHTCAAATGGSFSASTCSRASWDTSLAQASGNRTVTPVACNDDACGLQSTLTTTIPAGAGIHTVTVDGFSSSSSGTYTVAITRP